MFEHAGAIVPNDLIIEELITNYNQAGYPGFFKLYHKVLDPFDLLASCSERISIHMECNDPNHLRCFSNKVDIGLLLFSEAIQLPYNLCSSVEFEMKYKNGNVTYEDGKVLLKIPKELEDYKAGDDSLLDKLTDIINKIVEYLKKLCEKLGLKFDTRIEYDSEHNIKMEHSLGKPLKVIDKPDISTFFLEYREQVRAFMEKYGGKDLNNLSAEPLGVTSISTVNGSQFKKY